MIQTEPEGSTQGYPLVSVEVLSHGPSDAMHNPPLPLKRCLLETFIIKHAIDESDTHVLERLNTLAGNPVREILIKLNLPDHRILKDRGEEGLNLSRDDGWSYLGVVIARPSTMWEKADIVVDAWSRKGGVKPRRV
ncbi:hypothetical protein Tco_0848568 [Tanacetum coccineum]